MRLNMPIIVATSYVAFCLTMLVVQGNPLWLLYAVGIGLMKAWYIRSYMAHLERVAVAWRRYHLSKKE
jgi:hypothetical protein